MSDNPWKQFYVPWWQRPAVAWTAYFLLIMVAGIFVGRAL